MKYKLVSVVEKLDGCENRSRRNNLIIYGLKEPRKKTPEMLQDSLKEILEGKLGITTNTF